MKIGKGLKLDQDKKHLKLKKRSALCDIFLNLTTFVCSLSIFDALYKIRLDVFVKGSKPVTTSKNLIAEGSPQSVIGAYDVETHKYFSFSEVTGTPDIKFSIDGAYFWPIVITIILILLIFWKMSLLTKLNDIESKK